MKFNGSVKQNKWATDILQDANLTDEQTDNLLRYAGPAMYAQGIMDSTIVIENRKDLAAYADGLGRFYRLSKTEKHAVAEEAVSVVKSISHLRQAVKEG